MKEKKNNIFASYRVSQRNLQTNKNRTLRMYELRYDSNPKPKKLP